MPICKRPSTLQNTPRDYSWTPDNTIGLLAEIENGTASPCEIHPDLLATNIYKWKATLTGDRPSEVIGLAWDQQTAFEQAQEFEPDANTIFIERITVGSSFLITPS